MRVVVFCHSLRSDWNHGNAHFLRGVCSELLSRGHDVRVFEPEHAWSVAHLVAEHGTEPLRAFEAAYPELRDRITVYDPATLDVRAALSGADVALVHEWNDHRVVAEAGAYRRAHPELTLLFHDTHHRSVTDPASISNDDLREYDGVLAFGDVIRDLYLRHRWARRAWTWHEAADTRRFGPRPDASQEGDLVWIGNWGDDERTAELSEFLVEPVRALGLRARVYGVRYPADAIERLAGAGIEYGGWLPNYAVPDVFARYALTVHVPRRPYLEALPGIPTIRPFEALACGIPLVCARWRETGGLFTPGQDFITVDSGADMTTALAALLADAGARDALAARGRRTVLDRHTCAHRVDELLSIIAEVRPARELTATPEGVR